MPYGEDLSATLARTCIAATLEIPVEEIETWDCQGRQGVHDLRFEYQNRLIAVEAKLVIHEELERMIHRIKRAGYTPDLGLSRRWTVLLRHGADIREARTGLPAVLTQMEEHGWTDRLGYSRARLAGLADELDRLGVTNTWSGPPRTDDAGGFSLRPQSVWAFPDAVADLSIFVSDLLADETSELVHDLRRQLSTAADADERHAFLVVGHEHVQGWQLDQHLKRDLPSQPPRLPSPIDGVWLAGFTARTRVVAWLPAAGWIEGRSRPPEPPCQDRTLLTRPM